MKEDKKIKNLRQCMLPFSSSPAQLLCDIGRRLERFMDSILTVAAAAVVASGLYISHVCLPISSSPLQSCIL